MNRYFYVIEKHNSKKCIHIEGNIYSLDNGNYEMVEFTFLYYTIVDLRILLEQNVLENTVYEEGKYISDNITEQEKDKICISYFDGKTGGAELAFSEITEETPCGLYYCDL